MISDEKKKALDIAMAQIEKNFGKGSVMKLGEVSTVNVDSIPSGALSLDVALGIGGFPRGRVIEIYGPESSGKTTVALHAIAEAQKQGGIAAFIDAEHALDPVYARKLGVDVDNLIVSQPDTGEQALEIAEQLIRSGAVDIITIDSVAALVPKAEIDGEMGDSHVGLQARLMSQALRKLTGVLNKSKTKVKVVKNKVAPPFREAEFDIIYGEGISNEGCVLDLAVNLDIVDKSGAWFAYNGEKIGQGRENAKNYLKEHPEILKEIDSKVRENYNMAFEKSMGDMKDSEDEEE